MAHAPTPAGTWRWSRTTWSFRAEPNLNSNAPGHNGSPPPYTSDIPHGRGGFNHSARTRSYFHEQRPGTPPRSAYAGPRSASPVDTERGSTETTPLFDGQRPHAARTAAADPAPFDFCQGWLHGTKGHYRRNKTCWNLGILGFILISLVVGGAFAWSNQAQSLAKCLDGSELVETKTQLASTQSSLAVCGTDRTVLQKSVEKLKSANAVCDADKSHLQSSLSEARIRLGALQTSYDLCTIHERDLEAELNNANKNVEVCEEEKSELKDELRKHLVVQWMEWVRGLGTGGGSWVCSDDVSTWAFGLTALASPHVSLPIHVWHSDFSSTSEQTFRAGEGAVPPTAQIVGFKVISEVLNGNGWWKKRELDTFGAGHVVFQAMGTTFYNAKYKAEVYYVSETE